MASTEKSHIAPERVLRAAESLGLLGASASSMGRLMAILFDPKATLSDVTSLIEMQPALCARVLRVANSPYYGQRKAVTSIERASIVLGLNAVRGIAAAACANRVMTRCTMSGSIDMGAVLNHSLATAVACESLAKIKHLPLAGEAFVAGSLHHLGVAVQMSVDAPGVDALIVARRGDPVPSIRTLELEHASTRHEECAAIVFNAWQLPASLVAAVSHHHEPGGAPRTHQKLASLVNLGATLGLSCGYTFALEPMPGDRDVGAMTELGLSNDDIDVVENAIEERIESLMHAFADS